MLSSHFKGEQIVAFLGLVSHGRVNLDSVKYGKDLVYQLSFLRLRSVKHLFAAEIC